MSRLLAYAVFGLGCGAAICSSPSQASVAAEAAEFVQALQDENGRLHAEVAKLSVQLEAARREVAQLKQEADAQAKRLAATQSNQPPRFFGRLFSR
jgi:outer membrane murein-binding lipoprotein Lpp